MAAPVLEDELTETDETSPASGNTLAVESLTQNLSNEDIESGMKMLIPIRRKIYTTDLLLHSILQQLILTTNKLTTKL